MAIIDYLGRHTSFQGQHLSQRVNPSQSTTAIPIAEKEDPIEEAQSCGISLSPSHTNS